MSSSESRPGLLPGVDPAMYDARRRSRSPASHAALERMLAERRVRSRSIGAAGGGGDVLTAAAAAAAAAGPSGSGSRPVTTGGTTTAASHHHHHHYHHHHHHHHHHHPNNSIGGGGGGGQPGGGLPLDGSVAQRRAALLAPFGYAGRRPAGRRKSRGAGWHRRGWRDLGCMWINVKIGSTCVNGQDVGESMSLAAFVYQIQSSQGDYIPYGPYQTWDLRFRKKSLCQLVEDMEAQGLEEQDVIVRDLFDGGETVYYRVYDEDGNMIP